MGAPPQPHDQAGNDRHQHRRDHDQSREDEVRIAGAQQGQSGQPGVVDEVRHDGDEQAEAPEEQAQDHRFDGQLDAAQNDRFGDVAGVRKGPQCARNQQGQPALLNASSTAVMPMSRNSNSSVVAGMRPIASGPRKGNGVASA